MAWMRVDDHLGQHRKVLSIPRLIRKQAIGVWTLAGSWVAANLTDGYVPGYYLEEIGADQIEVDALVAAGLWHGAGHDCRACPQPQSGDYWVHDWLDVNPSRAQVEAERKAAAERQRRAREKAAEKRRGEADRHAVSHGVSHTTRHVTADDADDAPADDMLPIGPSRRDSDASPQDNESSHAVTHAAVTAASRSPQPSPTQLVGNSPLVGGVGGEASPQAAPPTPRRAATDRGTRLAEDWQPTSKTSSDLSAQYARPEGWWRIERERFGNYWQSKPGKDGRKIDWDKTWRNWVHEAVRRESRGGLSVINGAARNPHFPEGWR